MAHDESMEGFPSHIRVGRARATHVEHLEIYLPHVGGKRVGEVWTKCMEVCRPQVGMERCSKDSCRTTTIEEEPRLYLFFIDYDLKGFVGTIQHGYACTSMAMEGLHWASTKV